MRRTRSVPAAALGLAGACLVLWAARAETRSATAPSAPGISPAQRSARALELAKNAQAFEEIGAYARALEELQKLRPLVKRDADLELEMALLQARLASWDSAAVLLANLPLTKAMTDSQPASRRVPYPWQKPLVWTNGQYDGWSWYVWRARAELAAQRRDWSQALANQERAARERAWSGKEWVLLGVFQARVGRWEDAARSFDRGLLLEPILPEAHYYKGLSDWRSGHRGDALVDFGEAIRLDSLFDEAVLARARLRLGTGHVDSLPPWLLRGRSADALLTSMERPKYEEMVQPDQPAGALEAPQPHYPPSIPPFGTGHTAMIPVLVGEDGRVLIADPPYMNPAQWPDSLIGAAVGVLRDWRFFPGRRSGVPIRSWSDAPVHFAPSADTSKGGPHGP